MRPGVPEPVRGQAAGRARGRGHLWLGQRCERGHGTRVAIEVHLFFAKKIIFLNDGASYSNIVGIFIIFFSILFF